MKTLALLLLVLAGGTAGAQTNRIGIWKIDRDSLPCFSYAGALPYSQRLANGQPVKLPKDPWFLLGNYRLTVFTHVSGEYELITAERSWGRLNQGPKPNSGLNSATLSILNERMQVTHPYKLTGLGSLAADPQRCERTFGCGYARYNYRTTELTCERTLSVRPSTDPKNGVSAFLVTVSITNQLSSVLHLKYQETVTACYEMMQQQRLAIDKKTVRYKNTFSVDKSRNIVKADTRGVASDPFLFPSVNSVSIYDGFPPSLFIKGLTHNVNVSIGAQDAKDQLVASSTITVAGHGTHTLQFIVGYSFKSAFEAIDTLAKALMLKNTSSESSKTFGRAWRKVLPAFPGEKDTALAHELTWHAYTLEAMAKYNRYYDETEVPQGTVYDYDWGIHASARDHLQHALPLIYYNPKLAKSVLRYVMKKTMATGEIKLIESGYGYASALSYFTSDQQMFFFQLLSEYLRVTKDEAFLNEEINVYSPGAPVRLKVINVVKNCFTFLRDQIGVGQHGLVRLMNSDWNDAVYYIVKAPYNRVLYSGESHMNSAMVVTILGQLIPQIQHYASSSAAGGSSKEELTGFIGGMTQYHKRIQHAFMLDLGDRAFSRRMYFNGHTYGDSNMFLEPQGYMLQMKQLAPERKLKLLTELKRRVYAGEKLGAREQQTPEFIDTEFDKGSRENGGFWYALNGPVIIGVARFDQAEAMRLLKQMSFGHFAQSFPRYWSSYWSASDNVESSLIPMEGLPDQTWLYSESPVYCAHPHAWILYCYFKIREGRPQAVER